MEEQDTHSTETESPEQETQEEQGLDSGAKVILSLGCLGSLALASLLAYGAVVVGVWILHWLAQT